MKSIIAAALIAFAPVAAMADTPDVAFCSSFGVLMENVAAARDAGVPFADTVSVLRDAGAEYAVETAARVYLAGHLSPSEVAALVTVACLDAKAI